MGTNEKRRRSLRRQALFLLLFVALLAFGIYKFFELHSEADLLKLSFKLPNGAVSQVYKLEVARSDAERHKGLMYRKELGADRGIIFAFPEEKIQSFWMHNTYISLDMIFLDAKNKVVGILKRVPILNDEPRKVEAPSKFVIELNAGSADKSGIVLGSEALYSGDLSAGS